jgi:surface polysaccharide O-acyltransferase-like enzyme
MWVLLFLLSILVNLRDRKRILAIAGTFVLVSGLAYFAFMAAWLNVFVLIGYLRSVQVALALLAIAIGAVHVKDFFAFRRGMSLSIPEPAKARIYARVRSIVTAEHLSGAVFGAMTLAVLVNIVELLCTSGLPALYTGILTQQQRGTAATYGYLGLYIAAYMFDDAIMVAVVVWTLDKLKLQQRGGRWLKLLSGAAIFVLGVIMLVRPEWLR